MSFQKYRTNSYCLGKRYYGGTKSITGEIAYNKKNW